MSTREQAVAAITEALGKYFVPRPGPNFLRSAAEAAYEAVAPLIRAEQRERDVKFAEQHKATYGTFCGDRDCQHRHGTTATGRAPFADLLRAQP